MDDTDRRLIALLRQDARMNLATLAQKLGVSRGTVANRLDRKSTRLNSSHSQQSRMPSSA